MPESSYRIDKFLWAVRLFKTRSLASEACRKGKIQINGQEVKASKEVKVGDFIQVKKTPVQYEYKVLDVLQNRVGAALVPKYIQDITSAKELEKLNISSASTFFYRERGQGRPTKKDRREMDRIIDGSE